MANCQEFVPIALQASNCLHAAMNMMLATKEILRKWAHKDRTMRDLCVAKDSGCATMRK